MQIRFDLWEEIMCMLDTGGSISNERRPKQRSLWVIEMNISGAWISCLFLLWEHRFKVCARFVVPNDLPGSLFVTRSHMLWFHLPCYKFERRSPRYQVLVGTQTFFKLIRYSMSIKPIHGNWGKNNVNNGWRSNRTKPVGVSALAIGPEKTKLMKNSSLLYYPGSAMNVAKGATYLSNGVRGQEIDFHPIARSNCSWKHVLWIFSNAFLSCLNCGAKLWAEHPNC